GWVPQWTVANAGPGHRVRLTERSTNLGYVDDAASVGLGVDRELLAAVVSAVHDALGGDPLGLYLFGSATLGGLRPASDLDLLAVGERPMTGMQKEVLARGLLAISGRLVGTKRGRPVEVTSVVSSELRPWRSPPLVDFQYGEWLRSDFGRD